MKTNLKFWLLRLVFKILAWLHVVQQDDHVSRDPKLFLPFLLHLDKIYSHRGEKGFLLYVKGIRTALMNYLSGNPERVPGVKCTADGIPMALGALVPYIRGSCSPREILPYLNTILWSSRALNLGKLPNIETISQPASVQVPSDLGTDSQAFWRAIGTWPSKDRLPRALAWKKYRFSTKAGPNGQALVSSLTDLYILPEWLLDHIKVCGGEKLSNFISVLRTDIVHRFLMKYLPLSIEGKLRKITYFPDKEDKVRVIAILDYWSQEALKPLHHYLYRALKRIPQDCTFNQGSFRDKMDGCDWYYSIDLTAATDRFPISTISNVLKGALPENYVKSWEAIMVGLPFEFSYRGKSEMISYAVGNPMGAYSSWASFAITNHYLVWRACKDVNVDWSQLKYVLLGDDIVIGNALVGERYIELINSLGVEVSSLKTHKSQHFYEFAKRQIYKTNEITPFPVSAIKRSKKKFYLLMAVLQAEQLKGWSFREPVSGAVGAFYQLVEAKSSSYSKSRANLAEITDRIANAIRGVESAEHVVNYLIRVIDSGKLTDSPGGINHQHVLPNEQCDLFFRNFIRHVYCESLIPNPKSKRPLLGTISTNLVTTLTGDPEFYSLLSAPGLELHMIPFLQVYGLVEEKYWEAQKGVLEIDLRGEDWPLLLRSITFSLYDDVFVTRSSDLISRASATLGRKLYEYISSQILNHSTPT